MKFDLLPEPKLEFGDNFICDDPKKGISIGGFYSTANHTHRSEVRISIIGTKRNIQDLKDWIAKLADVIEATEQQVGDSKDAQIVDGEIQDLELGSEESLDKIGELFDDYAPTENKESETFINKRLNPDFIGFNKNSTFKCEFLNDPLNNIDIKQDLIDAIISSKSTTLLEKGDEVINLYRLAFVKHLENFNTRPDVCLIVIPSNVFKKLHSISAGKYKINFRRKLKAVLLQCGGDIPVQLILEDTILKKKQMQDLSMVAWNFTTAQYYKTDSIPWALTDIDKDSCFVGISFHSVLSDVDNLKRSSIAQAFNREGKGLIFVGKQFNWDVSLTHVRAPHLKYEYAKNLMSSVIETYVKQNRGLKPRRVVVHKTTEFWNSSINIEYAEVEGIKDGIRHVLGEAEIDLVTIKDSEIKLFRTTGIYPVARGTLFEIDKTEGVLYTTGYIPYFETFPGMHMPLGKSIQIFEGESTLRNVCNEILALTKMNFNNCNYYDSLPITLRFAQKVGEIIQYLPQGFEPPSKYYFYM